MNKIKLFILFLYLSISSLPPSYGFIVVDFEEIPNGRTRVVALNTRTQQLLLYKEASQILAEHLNNYVLSFSSTDNIQVKRNTVSSLIQEPMIIRSKKVISGCEAWQPVPSTSHHIYSSQQITVKSPQEIQTLLPQSKEKEKVEGSFFIRREGDKGMKTIESLSNAQKGALGELTTTLTMLSFGYSQHPSKYGGDWGLDGIFEDWSHQYLFLTQTKQEQKPRTAKNIMEKFLNEGKIWETIQEMERIGNSDAKATAALVKSYMQENSQAIYKMAYRMMDKGIAQCKVCPLDIQGFPRKGPKLFNTPLKEKIKSVQNVIGGLETTPEQQFTLVLNAIPLTSMSKEQILALAEKAYDEQNAIPVLSSKITMNNIQVFPAPTLNRENRVSVPFSPALSLGHPSTSIIPPVTIDIQSIKNQTAEPSSQIFPFVAINRGLAGATGASDVTITSVEQNPVVRTNAQPAAFPPPILPVSRPADHPLMQQAVLRNAKETYNRENFFNFLIYLKQQNENKRTIAARLKGTDGASANSIGRLMGDRNYAPSKSYEFLWNALKNQYPERFQEWQSE